MIVQPEQFDDVLRELEKSPVLGVDTETTGLEWYFSDKLFAIILSDDKADYYFDERVLGPDFSTKLSTIFLNENITKVFKNAKFDMHMLLNAGLKVRGPVEDIGIGARILKNDFYGQKAYSLASLAAREGKQKLTIVEDYIKKNNLYELRLTRLGTPYKQPCFDRVPLDVVGEYGSMDGRLTYDLRQLYLSRMDEDDRKIYNNESELIKVCFDMERGGIRLDLVYTQKGYDYEQEKLKEKYREFHMATGMEYRDSKEVLIPLFERAGEKIALTDKGNPSLTDDILESYTSPAARMVQGIRYSEKRISTYYENYINGVDANGFIHPSMWQEGTRTGRFSYSNPNLQNIPKEEGSQEPYVIRGCFVPRPGNVFVSLDYSQMEYRMMLAYANEERLIKEVMDGKDIHQATADLLGIARSPAKTLNFAILYGAGIEKIATMLGVSVQEAARLRTKYFLGLPKVERLIDAIIRTTRSRGYVKNWFGRKLRADFEFAYATPNHLIQGGGADVVKLAMNQIHPLFKTEISDKTFMVLQVHDQLVFDMHPQDFGVIPMIKDIMETVWPVMNGMKLLVDVEWSPKSFADRDLIGGMPDENLRTMEAVC